MIYTCGKIEKEKKKNTNEGLKRKMLSSETELKGKVKAGAALGWAWEFSSWPQLPACLNGRQRPLEAAELLEAVLPQIQEGWEGSLLSLPSKSRIGTFPQVL